MADLEKLSSEASQGGWTVERMENEGTSSADKFFSYGIECGPHTILDTLNSSGGVLEQENHEDGCTVWDEQARRDLTYIAALVNDHRAGRLISVAPTSLAASLGDGEEIGRLERVRHLKRGTEYEVLARGVRLQGDAHEPETLVFYRGADGQHWVREEGEFDDDRFERIDVQAAAPAREKPLFRTGDSILHKPSGEMWVCAWADPETGYLSWLGWPPGEAKISDFELVEAATDELHRKRLRDLKASGRRDAPKALRLYGDPDADEAAA